MGQPLFASTGTYCLLLLDPNWQPPPHQKTFRELAKIMAVFNANFTPFGPLNYTWKSKAPNVRFLGVLRPTGKRHAAPTTVSDKIRGLRHRE